ncbi:MAG: MarR family transcriptional regulator [Bdellovibrionaceae bacterium]|nr:MarR family transcriptional regulator [Pseudobdellovibrionaceae bacterium]
MISESYPEVDPLSLYTHVQMRHIACSIEDAMEKFLSEHRISSGRFFVLMALELEEKGIKPSKLSSNLGVTQATITGLIDGLSNHGLVQRREHDRDGRACVVTLTTKGREFIRELRPQFNRWIGSYYGVINAEEKNQLIRLLEKFHASVKAPSHPADE